MKTPFVYGRLAFDNNFTNRRNELTSLTNSFTSGTNSILISPRRWGKSSLVQKAAKLSKQKNPKLHFCFIDLFNTKTEEEFYKSLTKEVIRSTSRRIDEIFKNSRKFFVKFIPKLTFSPDSTQDFSLSLNWQEVKAEPDEILNLAESIAKSKNIKIIVCIDEFQNISTFDKPMAFQKRLRSHWQKHQNTSYCLYGSKRHMMMEVFASSEMPFYKFGDLMFLNKIETNDWVKFIIKRYKQTGKSIDKKTAELISQLADCHPYYVQQLAQQSWLRTEKNCNTEIVIESHDSIIQQLSLLFQTITDNLSFTQTNFLRALIDNIDKLSSNETIENYKLGSSSNVNRIKKALLHKDIIDIIPNKIDFIDPMYKAWLKKYYFQNSI